MDESGLRLQLEQHHAVSYGWALSCCSYNKTEAEDVLQTAYLKILQGRARYDGRAAFKTWLFAVVRNTALDTRRRFWLRRLRLEKYVQDYQAKPDAAGPDDNSQRSDLAGKLRDALGRLPRRQREVLHLSFYQDLTLQEAAQVMGVTLGSARQHYERGKSSLRERFKYPEYSHE